ncbi:MAG: DNA polymerase III subunit delta [Candidatus Magasanikbacteria bacterium]|nr:DNA polymerase III subunit delta [Candidatus Magasanikbacteria bacterium]
MLIFLYGTDTFRSRQQLKKMIAKFRQDRDPGGYNVAVLDCQKEEGGKIMEQILSAPFLAEKRMVVLENFLSATGRGDLQEEILKRITNKTLPESTVLVFYESPSAPSTSSGRVAQGKPKTKVAKELFDILSKEKFSQQFDLLIGVKLISWILQEVKDHGGKINQPAAQYLAQNVGGDMWRLSSLVKQLIAFKQSSCHPRENGDPEIALSDVQLFLDEKADDSIFNLVDAVVGGQAKKAFEMIREQYRIGEDAQFVFAMLLRQFRILLELRDLYDREDNLSSEQLAKKLNLHPFVVKKSLVFVKKYSLAKLKTVYQRLLDLDVKTKTGQGDQSLLLDVFVGTV